ncbi:MAG: bifunctional glutamate N-acetyltransferase/amino-acid acetyltransferase ArgJ [Ruminococcaceae bacterium]|nr:bifunctional glutamate N-acetyltransferase/amino-acid acetyltransferase ArgJ [Oscillospiraceae bacterium]
MEKPIDTTIDGGVTAPRGYLAGAVYVGVKSRKKHKPDVAMLVSERPCAVAAMFTTNRFCAAPVTLDRAILSRGKGVRAIVINSGNANAGTGERGLRDAKAVETEAERLLELGEDEVFVCSTGVIGENLPVDKVTDAMRRIVPALSPEHGSDAAWAICTTDRTRKEAAYELPLSGGTVRVGVMAKGSGMIHPNMATMLVFLTTDARADADFLRATLRAAVDRSFHLLTVDGDTSTNDSIFLLANGASGVAVESAEDRAAFAALIEAICVDMARRIASDGEGSTHLIEVEARGLPTERDARLVARSIAGSTLFKAAVYGRDANWGRIMAAAGYSGADVDPTHADCVIRSAAGEVQVMRDGFGTDFDEALATRVLSEHDVAVSVSFHQGGGEATAWGCDLTGEYVHMNGDYRT